MDDAATPAFDDDRPVRIPLWMWGCGGLLGLLAIGLLLVTFGVEARILPSIEVIPGEQLTSAERDYLDGAGIVEEGELVLYFYSTGIVSIRAEGNLLTDRRVVSYQRLDGALEIDASAFADVESFDVDWADSGLEDTELSVFPRGEDEGFLLYLSAEGGGDALFVERFAESIGQPEAVPERR